MTNVIHVSGIAVTIDGRCIQRCIICGQKILDTEEMPKTIHLRKDFNGINAMPFPIGSYVAVDQDSNEAAYMGTTYHPVFESSEMPDNACIKMGFVE